MGFDSMGRLVKIVSLLLVPAAAFAQDVISAQAGMINHLEGRVFLKDESLLEHPGLIRHIEPGQRLRTDDGHAEVLFAVGTYLWLANHSELEMVSAGITRARIRLHRGSIIIDSRRLFDADSLAVLVGDAEIKLIKEGLYRFDVTDAEGPSITVVSGEVLLVSGGGERRIKKRRMVRFGDPAGKGTETSFKRWEEDALTAWQAKRANVIAEALRKQGKQKDQDDSIMLLQQLPDRGRAGIRGP